MKIFTPVWGPKHIELLDLALGQSLKWPRNNISITNAEWVVVTENENDLDQIKDIINKIGTFKITEHFIPGVSMPYQDMGRMVMPPLMETIESCLSTHEPMLMATPDFIFADGTLDAFQKVGEDRGSCVSIAHMRVLPSILKQIPIYRSNKDLMTLALANAHPSWTEASSNYHKGGIIWNRISDDMLAVRHFMPSPYFVNFIPQDLEYLQEIDEGRAPGFGLWDHIWPKHLIKEGRLRFIGSSEAAMMIEVTDHNKNVPPKNESGDQGFFRKHFHNDIQNQFVSIFKGRHSDAIHSMYEDENSQETKAP